MPLAHISGISPASEIGTCLEKDVQGSETDVGQSL